MAAAGLRWYEVSNWSKNPDTRCEHNMAYWRGADWWGFGPGAHSHVGGVRFWNAKHPAAYAQRLATGVTPAVGRERPDADARRLERIPSTEPRFLQIKVAVIEAGLIYLREHPASSTATLFEYPFTVRGLRRGLALTLRAQARVAPYPQHRYALVDMANKVRPATWF